MARSQRLSYGEPYLPINMETDMNLINLNHSAGRISLRRSSLNIGAFLLAMLALTMSATSPARAEIDTFYSGAQCVVTPGYSGTVATTSTFGNIGNASKTETLELTCPATRDLSSSGIGYGIVSVISQYAGDPVSCELFAVNISSAPFGVFSIYYDLEFAGAPSPDSQYLNFGALPSNDHYYYTCELPPVKGGVVSQANASYINAYRIHQN
jgi:hypothetical protein